MSIRSKAIIALIITAACFPLFSIVARLSNDGFAPMTQVYLRVGLAFILSAFLFRKKVSLSKLKLISHRDWMGLLLMGVIGYGFNVYFSVLGAIQEKLLNVAVIGSTEILMVYILSIIIFRQKPKVTIFFFIFLSLIGISFIASKSFSPSFAKFGSGDIAMLLWAFTSALYIIGRQVLSERLNNEEITLIVMCMAVATAFVLAIFLREPFSWQNLFIPTVFAAVIFGAILNTIVIPLQNFAYKYLSGVAATQILLLGNVFSFLYGYVFYKELISVPELVGAILILSSVYLTNKYTS